MFKPCFVSSIRCLSSFCGLRQFSFLAAIVSVLLLTVGCDRQASRPSDSGTSSANANNTAGALTPETEASIVAFCGDCHAMPLPTSFPREAWRDEVRRGFGFYFATGRSDLTVPTQADAQQYFVSRAPQNLALSPSSPPDSQWVERFERCDLFLPDASSPAISFIDWVDTGSPLGRGIVLSDMRGGGVYFIGQLSATQSATQGKPASVPQWASPLKIGQAKHPAVVRFADWDGDGVTDFLVSDLGSFLPADHDLGQVLWYRQNPESPGTYAPHVVQRGLGRVASLEVVDLNRDKQLDLLVAEFGWQTTGSIFALLRNESDPASNSEPAWGGLQKRVIDSRPGTIHLPVVDLNDDGAPDFVALISQHHERVEAMMNDGQGNFKRETIYDAGDPSFGSSGIQLVDMNGDGRMDVVHTNGDSFDSFVLKPFHGVRWLENRGSFPFTAHEIGSLPGVHRGFAGDVDGNGKLDIVAGVFLPRELLLSNRYERAESLVLWLQQAKGDFQKHVLSAGDCQHAALHLKDLNADGNSDLIVGYFRDSNTGDGPAVTLWLSREK